MMNNKTIKKAVLSCTLIGALAVISTPSLVLAQASEASAERSLLSLYSDYADARYAVQWKVPTGDLSGLREKMPRYGYLMYYTSNALLASPRGPFVQFGFFKSAEEAGQFVEDNKAAFPGLRVVNVQADEHKALLQQTEKGSTSEATDVVSGYYWLNDGRGQSRAALQSILTEAKALYINRQYERALEYYSALSLVADSEVAHWALELKGLTQESLGQKELALETYRRLLADSQGGESWVGRVTQRSRALETAADDEKGALRRSKYSEEQSPYYYRGILGQSYNYVTAGGKNTLDRDVLSIIATNFDATAGYRHPEHIVEVRLNGFTNYDLLDYPDDWLRGTDNRTVIKRGQVAYTHVDTGLKAVGGRQKDVDSGMYMYFDGLSVKYPLNNKMTLGVSAGVPVQFSEFYDWMDRQFYSALATYDHNEKWRAAAYITHQTLFGEIDRAAWGGRLQYVGDRFTSYLNLDYDYEFAEVNIFRWSATYKYNDQHQLSATYGLQRSPFLSSTNILLGQPYLEIENYLRDQFNRDYLLYHALERTGIYEYGTLSHHYKVDESMHITTDLYQAVSSDMPIFDPHDDGIHSTVLSSDAEYRYTSLGVQAVVTDFLGMDDTATLSFRHADTTELSSNTLRFSERLRFWDNKVFITPKFQLKYTQKKQDDTSRSNLRGSIALSYKPRRNIELKVEGGNEVIRYLQEKATLDYSYLLVGYQLRF